MTCKALLLPLWLAASVAVVTASVAFAADAKPPTGERLPGVDGGYSIVKPAPEPAEEALPAGTGQFRIGDTDVRISGSIAVDIGAGGTPTPRR